LALLVVRFPAPTQFQAGRLAMTSLVDQGFHGVLLKMAPEREPGLSRQQGGNRAQRQCRGEECDLMETAQEQKTPTAIGNS
jgi:hypothetical protein